MICADTSSLVAFLGGEKGHDVELVIEALTQSALALAPVTIVELLSDPQLAASLAELLLGLPQLEIIPGYWERAGTLRTELVRYGFRPKIADILITQSCLDHEVSLVTRDRGFSPFQKLPGLRLL